MKKERKIKITYNKKALYFVIILVVILVILVILLIQENNLDKNSCKVNEDCVAASCCHPTSCVNKENVPSCEGIFCTQECVPNTLDCGQGSCKCISGKCVVAIENKTGKLPNPASVYCIEHGGKLEIRENELGQYGMCIKNNKECEEWEFYRGECKLD